MRNEFSRKLKEIFSMSLEGALRTGAKYIGMEHILLGLISDNDNNAPGLMTKAHIEMSGLQKALLVIVL
jgi:ATP-dependent Clp protease ATP-binding subunit ClpA